MIDAGTRFQIDQFLNELQEWLKTHEPEGDYRWLYAKYPKVRICIRRAMLAVKNGVRCTQKE